MSTFKVTKVEFEPPIEGEPVKPFAGWVCIGYDSFIQEWYSGADPDSPEDAYKNATRSGERELMPHTVQMFRVDLA